jgi:hypothetical protein
MSHYSNLIDRLRTVTVKPVPPQHGISSILTEHILNNPDGPAAVDAIEHLMNEIDFLDEHWRKNKDHIAELKAAFREIYEVYAGSDGFIPETCAEGYQQQLIKEMADIAAKHMRKGVGEKE